MLREAAPHTQMPSIWGKTLGNWPPAPRLRGKRESFLEKRGLGWASEYLKVEEQNGLPQQKEGRRERAMSSKAGLHLRQGTGEGRCWVCNTHLEKPVSILYMMGTRGGLGARN